MKYFRLSPDCFLVEGRKDAVIYDVPRSRVFVLDGRAFELLRSCEDNQPLDDRLEGTELRFLEQLRDERLGSFESEPCFVDKLLLRAPVEWRGFCMQPPDFHKVDWAFTSGCDLDCGFCGRPGETVSWQSCLTCVRQVPPGAPAWWPADLDGFVDGLAGLGAPVLNLRGGNPLHAWERLQAVLRSAARHPGITVVVTTPGTGQPIERVVELARRERVRLNLVFLGPDRESVAAACGDGAVFDHQTALIDALEEAGAVYFVNVLLSAATRGRRGEITRLFQERWGASPAFGEVLLRGECGEGFRFSHVGEKQKTLSPWRSMEEFYFRVKTNTCLQGTLQIAADGRVRPCAGIDRAFGDVGRDGLREALADDRLYELWELDKGQVKPCDGCALRFACADCTTAELPPENGAGDGAGCGDLKHAYCDFDPDREGEGARAYTWSWSPPEFVRTLSLETEQVG